MIKAHSGMEQKKACVPHLPPRKHGTMVRQFTEPGEFHYACLIARHFEADMTKKTNVVQGKG